MRMTEQELEAYIRQYTELEKECMKSRFPEKFSNEEFWNQRSREKQKRNGGICGSACRQRCDHGTARMGSYGFLLVCEVETESED